MTSTEILKLHDEMGSDNWSEAFNEMANQEVQYTGNIQEVSDVLELRGTNIKPEHLKKVYRGYMDYCINHDRI